MQGGWSQVDSWIMLTSPGGHKRIEYASYLSGEGRAANIDPWADGESCHDEDSGLLCQGSRGDDREGIIIESCTIEDSQIVSPSLEYIALKAAANNVAFVGHSVLQQCTE
jgi:hypothetical protein